MVSEGVDGQSRAGAKAVHDTTVSERTWGVIQTAAKDAGFSLAVDWFASAGNARLERYWTQFEHPDAEGIDALSADSWGHSSCACGRNHSIDGYWFPPLPMLAKTFAKLKRDGGRGVILASVPAMVGEPWYPFLQEAAISQVHLRDLRGVFESESSSSYSSIDFEWMVVAFSFGVHEFDQPCDRWQERHSPRPSAAFVHARIERAGLQEQLLGHFRRTLPCQPEDNGSSDGDMQLSE